MSDAEEERSKGASFARTDEDREEQEEYEGSRHDSGRKHNRDRRRREEEEEEEGEGEEDEEDEEDEGEEEEDDEEGPRRSVHHARLDRRDRELNDQDLARIAEDVSQRYKRAAVRYTGDMNEVPQRLLMPSVQDANLWQVRCKVGIRSGRWAHT